MTANALTLHWPNADATAQCGIALGKALRSGDVVLLSGPVGSGKTHFARALIQSLLITPEDVPSPTFTLVQTYDTRAGALWHADLYRVSMDTEVDELGLGDAFENASSRVEWPDRLGPLTPADALLIDITPQPDSRTAHLSWTDAKWQNRLADLLQHV